MLFPYNRLYDLFRHIHEEEFSPVQKLSAQLGVSDRTIRSDVALINELLEGHGAKAVLKRKAGYHLELSSPSLFASFLRLLEEESDASQPLDSQEGRVSHLAQLLLAAHGYLDAGFLAEQVYISRSTLVNYLKILMADLGEFKLDLVAKPSVGYQVIGRERDKRSYLASLLFSKLAADSITGFSREEAAAFPGLDLYQLKSSVSGLLADSDIRISDLNLKRLALHAAITVTRIQQGYGISIPETIECTEPMRAILDAWISQIEEMHGFAIREEERKFLYLHLVSSCEYDAQLINGPWLDGMVRGLVDAIYRDFSIDLRVDDTLIGDLTRHLRSNLKAKALNIHEANPMLDTIRSHFPLPYEIALTSLQKAFSGSGFEFTADDIAYIALHIGAAMERFFAGRREKRKALLLCGFGLSAARMLETMLNKYFRDSLNISSNGSYTSFSQLKGEDLDAIDFIISTHPLSECPVPFVTVSFPATSRDIEAISRTISGISRSRSQSLLSIFQESLFVRMPDPESKHQVLERLSTLLERPGYAPKGFLSMVLEREELGSTNMSELFALPHPASPCASQTKVAVALLESPVRWNGDETAQLIFLLSLKAGEEENLDRVYDLLTEIMNNPLLCKRLLKAEDFQEFTGILGEYL